MTHIASQDRSQTLLLPESLDEYVGPNNPTQGRRRGQDRELPVGRFSPLEQSPTLVSAPESRRRTQTHCPAGSQAVPKS
jgi:hypothetical protein